MFTQTCTVGGFLKLFNCVNENSGGSVFDLPDSLDGIKIDELFVELKSNLAHFDIFAMSLFSSTINLFLFILNSLKLKLCLLMLKLVFSDDSRAFADNDEVNN